MDPLRFNLEGQTQKLLSQIARDSPYSTLLQNVSRLNLLDTLSGLLRVPQFTMVVAALFRPILLDLCARWLHRAEEETLDKLEALCLLLEIHPELYPVLLAFLRAPENERGPLRAFISTPPVSVDAPTLHRTLLAYYRILQANRTLPRLLGWSLTPLSQLIWSPHPNNGVRSLAIRCYALQVGMAEGERVKVEKEVLGDISEVDCFITYGANQDGTARMADGWVLPVIELERVTRARDALLSPQEYFIPDDDSREPIHPAELSPMIANVHGILMLRSSLPTHPSSTLIDTPTAVQALRQISLHLSMQLPLLLTSAPSAGKSLLISHLADILYPNARNHIVTIHLADTSLDPRSLLGSYVSSPTRSGTFEWKEGVLVRAMREGKWVVLEDIDRATMEVLGLIKPLVESVGADKWIGGRARLDVPNRGTVEAEDSFALFATRALQPTRSGAFPNPTFFGAHKFYEVTVGSPSANDLRLIVNTKFPRLSGVPAQGLINMWESVRALGSPASTRNIGLRELEKLCTRVTNLLPASHQCMDVDEECTQPTTLSQIYTNPTIREDIFLEARDVFFGSGATTASGRAHLDAVAHVIAGHLGLSGERRDWIMHTRTPDFDVEKDVNGRISAVRAGRTRLPARTAKADIASPITRPFAMHRPAISLIARLASAISLSEPVLLTGETGTGKTSVVTHLASLLRRPLISLNLSNQTESSDILGGFKPVDARVPGGELQERFLELFGGTFSRKKNAHFEESVRKAVQERKWKRAAGLWLEAVRLAKDRIKTKQAEDAAKELDGGMSRKRRKVDSQLNVSMESWEAFERDVQTFEVHHVQGKSKFAFAFVEGPLVKALRNGDWILLDEVNLATPETLESVSGLLHGPTASITLTEQGSLEPIPRHPDFRLFACMNPATDVGKKDLPPNIRSRFTEIDVPPPDADKDTLLAIVAQYIGACAVGDKGAIMDVAEFYTAVKRLAEERQIADGSNHRPHFSMRTLARALTFASDMATTYSLRRALWEGCLMAFTMALDGTSATAVTALAHKHILAGVRNPRSLLTKEPLPPGHPSAFIKFGPFYLERGPLPEDLAEDYIMTPSVETKLVDLARIISAKRFPVLIEGPTSSGKTSSIEYLAKRTGHRFVRINNHEHTDIQEYIGTYVSDPVTGKLVFKEGLLVRALRQGDWIVLDELNLAPTDVLEALNRLLDDNRELVIPETQEVVRPHPHFMLFATQNPPGLYAGRKVLSRAFRNRFLEVHFEDVPQAELETILCQRCRIAPSYGQRIVSVFRELQKRRQSSRVFESKHGFATLRDLFRWAGRDAMSYEELAANGYMLLAERARRDDDKVVVKEVIESIMKVRIDDSSLYDLRNPKFDPGAFLGCPLPSSSQIVWTAAMQRLFVLTARALRFNEPVLLVGETGCGKTSVCQLYAEVLNQTLRTVNCHQNTETADLIGGLRPIRNKAVAEAETLREAVSVLSQLGIPGVVEDATSLAAAIDGLLKGGSLPSEHIVVLQDLRGRLQRLSALFEWRDGPLVEAMRNGDVFLLDEISLADDSVLERLNSVLETGRTIVLAEQGGNDAEIPAIKATDDFKLVATMNPGGDYGKKELSPALRNRFTEIWVPPITDRKDLECIVATLWQHDALKTFTQPVLDFIEWLWSVVGDRSFANLRDILAWVSFSNAAIRNDRASSLTPSEVFHHAAQMTFLDGLGSMPQLSAYSKEALDRLKLDAAARLQDLVPIPTEALDHPALSSDSSSLRFGIFSIPRGLRQSSTQSFSLEAPTTRDNVMRVVRACQLPKPIMLEGSPGVGKTSLVAALANMCGYHLCRINLSDQTDLVDLFGSDLPVEGGEPGQFAWKDAEFLRALQEGHWVLLDEMNLAPQSVLEGLNAVLDHRGTVYIPELGRSFVRHPSFRIFAAQNPLHQGGGRKGLPKSFLNRFTKVYVQEMSPNDLLLICRNLFPKYPVDLLRRMIAYMAVLNEETMVKRSFAREGAPWEFNLRDVIRWATLLHRTDPPAHPSDYLSSVILGRFRTSEDRGRARELFSSLFPGETRLDRPPVYVAPTHLQIGHHHSQRAGRLSHLRSGRVLQSSLPALESLGMCIENGWLAILTGPRNSGKTALVRTMAGLLGKTLREVSINNSTDATDVLGSFEETDLGYCISDVVQEVINVVDDVSCSDVGSRLLATTDHITMLQSYARATPTVTVAGIVNGLTEVLKKLRELPEPHKTRCSRAQARVQELSGRRIQAARLEWVDGPLVRALKEGHWLLLDGANLCNPSVLDRLNSLCEMGGSLALNERGAVNGEVQILYPHPDFRLFMCADAQYGELSRAMRNRGIEIALTSSFDQEDLCRLADHLRCSSVGLCNVHDLKQLVSQHALLQRGLGQHSQPRPDSLRPSASRLLPEDSSNAVVAILGPEVISPSRPATGDRAVLHFLSGNIIPIALPHLSRYISHSDPPFSLPLRTLHTYLGTLECSHLYHTIIQMRKDFSQTSAQVSGASQPLYAISAMTSPTALKEYDEASILLYLRLFVAVTMDYGEPHSRDDPTTESMHTSERARLQHQAATKVKLLVESIREVALALLGASSIAPERHHVDIFLEIVAYGRFLSHAVQASGAFDFSLTMAAFEMIKRSVSEHSSELADVVCSVKAVEEIISLKSGAGLVGIWRALSSKVPLVDSQLYELEDSDLRVPFALNDPKLRAQVLDLMSMWNLSRGSEKGQTNVLERLTAQLKTRLVESTTLDDNVKRQTDFTYIFAQFRALVSVSTSTTESQLVVVQDLIDFGCSNQEISLITLIPYRQLLWISDAHESIIQGFMHAQRQLLAQMWEATPMAGISGPSALLHPVELSTSVLICDDTLRPAATLPQYEHVLRQRLSWFSSHLVDATSRFSETATLLTDTALMIAACVEPQETSYRPESSNISSALEKLDSVKDSPFSSVYKAALRPSLWALSRSQGEYRWSTQGRCWIALSRLLLTLYVPNVPIDPSAVRQCVGLFWSEQRALYEAELALQREHEQRTFGRQDNTPIRYLLATLEDIRQRATPETEAGPPRSDVIRLHAYWTEITQFLEQVVSVSKVDAIISALDNCEASASMREQVLQESTAAFSQRLVSAYGEYADISMPIQLALLQLRFGLRLIADANSAAAIGSTEDELVAEAIVSFPSVKGLRTLKEVSLQQTSNTSFSFTLWRLAGVALEVASGVELPSSISHVEPIYEQSLRLWMIDKARKEEAERQEQSLYRRKTELNGPATDADLEEQEFLALFPEYADLLEEPTTTSDNQTPRRPVDMINSLDMKRLSKIHQNLFGVGSSSTLASSSGDELARLRDAIVHDVLVAQASHQSEALDQHSRPYQISLLLEQQRKLQGVPRVSSMPANFYADPHVPEIRKSSEVLRRMVARLSTLIQEWPDQMVLQHLKNRCDAILQLDIFSPVAKVLSAIEQLLLQMEDWEMYANRENTLKSYQHELASLVVSWRRLELTSWQGLLRTQAQDFAEGVSEWWFRLYEATVRGVAAASEEDEGNEDAVSKYLEGLVPLLDSFMTSSPLGQFSARLEHLRAFEVYCLQLGKRSPSSRRVHRILHSTRLYYAQFLPRVAASLSSQQHALEKDVRDFIKLASWKDINVHALKQSAQRTHRQLYKCVRKFREILRQSVAPHLVPTQAGKEESSSAPTLPVLRLSGDVPPLPPFSASSSHPDHLRHLDRTFKNFRTLIQGRVGNVVGCLTSADLEDLSAEIIATLQSLASTAAPANASKEQREKFQKALLVRKRKAWSDLLKELKRVGLAMNMKPEILEQQGNPRWLREQPHLIEPKSDLGPFDKSEVYFLRLTKLLPDLRAALGSHHPDIGTRDLQRGTNLVESAFSFAVDTRACYVEVVERYLHLQASVSRLHKIGAEPRVVASGPDVHHRVTGIKEDLGRLVNALDETSTIWQQYLQEFPATVSLPEALEEVQAAHSSTQAMFNSLADVTAKLRMLAVPVLLESEATAVQQALDHVGTVVQLLRRWASGPNIVAHFVRPLLQWTEQSEAFKFAQFVHELSEVSTDTSGELIDRLLLCVQGILSLPLPPSNDNPDVSETLDRFIREYTRLISQFTRSLKVDEVQTLFSSVVDDAVHASPDELEKRLARTLPFLDAYLELARVQLTNHCAWMKALFKLDYVICSVMHSIAKDGFCKPPEAGEGEAGEAGMEDAGGMGLGEGAGSENVSKEIEDESQVEGLQDEAGEDEDVERAEEGNALEMSEDIGGKMQDVPDKEGDDEEGEEEEEGEEPEEQIGDLDATDPSAVDEKLWGDESGPEDSKDDGGKSAEDHSTTQQQQESETVAKEDNRKKSSKDKEKAKEQEQEMAQEGKNEEAEGEGKEELEEGGEDGEMEEGEPDQQGGAPLDDFVPEAETLDLPDDMDFGKEDGKEPQLDDDIEMDDEEGGEEEERPGEDMEQDAEEEDVMDTEGDNPQAVPEDGAQPDGPTEDMVDATAAPDLHACAGQDSGQSGDQAMADANQGAGGQGPSSSGEAGGPEEPAAREEGQADASAQEDHPSDQTAEPSATANESVEEGKEGTGSARSRQGAAPSQAKPQPLQHNPLRSLGDALREISQRIDEILESEGAQSRPEPQADTSGPSQMEYLRPEDDKGEDEMQALGPAQQEDVAKLNDLKFLDEEMEDVNAIPPVEESSDVPPEPTSHSPQSALHAEHTAQTVGEDVKSALTQTEIRSQQPGSSMADPTQLLPSDRPLPSDEADQNAQEEVELALRQWQVQGQPEQGAEEVWRKYESLTHDLSFALCEQLRLILEPTMATRLKGDYRTGKRLNMKKIIPYIASEFTKDKIWLRRTRPSQREYQVLIAIDDSRSMAESHSVHLAFQTLALVSKALGKLEVGDIAIAKFGEAVDVLHGFDGGPFTDQAGTKVMSAFHFDQKATQVLSLLETSLKLLEQARERRAVSSASAGDLWQLEIIISDGICQDHERLRTVLRRAEEQRVMVVFIVLDSLHSKSAGSGATGKNESSILSMNQVAYKMVDGRMDIQVERYLDTFPFEYYVVLRNVEALPDVLSGTLKQFFERIAES
ncbi:midasin [Lentinus tigrinus ALCF2SS1-7]|uniref:Midasin n=1 Tax=Lentinus tigrinus ALCF2SS1-6 TaxID=1328759 RepID=A0A5C2SMC6_9APHY|nr:midasin [Lentinus tigrinus ALCF2SS1-6]RPD77607.1 midasin [Lentinus tigrinus ALCF2SS1-7]